MFITTIIIIIIIILIIVILVVVILMININIIIIIIIIIIIVRGARPRRGRHGGLRGALAPGLPRPGGAEGAAPATDGYFLRFYFFRYFILFFFRFLFLVFSFCIFFIYLIVVNKQAFLLHIYKTHYRKRELAKLLLVY